jgi:ketosteroid isomerase-like protein
MSVPVIFSAGKDNLESLYTDSSVLVFEGDRCQGKAAIMKKLQGLTFKQIQHNITHVDSIAVESGTAPGVHAFFLTVLGQLKTDEDPVHGFTQTFLLRYTATGSFYIATEVFRMVLHN